MLEHAFRFVGRVLFVVGEKNFRSQKALEKIGARFLRKVDLPGRDGIPQANVVFAIRREEYKQMTNQSG
jgi:N-acetyltransferase